MAVSDLPFYAISDIKSLVEGIKARDAKTNPHEKIQKTEDTEQASVGIGDKLNNK
ncbi:hypothetical protein MMC21_003857, partial [Puttea exsequens]|nr:hypothetical protein [Puttea exsequens]